MTSAPSRERAATVWRDGASAYGKCSRLLHGGTAALLLISFGLAWTWDIPGRGPTQSAMIDLHRRAGLLILLITFVRIGWRMTNRPATVDDLARWMRILARATQAAMLGLLVVIPLVGWAYTNAGGFDVTMEGFALPKIAPKDSYLAEMAVDIHENLAILLIALVALHVAGAAWHRFRPERGRGMPSSFLPPTT
jgi:cytochrome b561